MLEMPDVEETDAQKKERKKKAQRRYYEKWRDSPKGQAYRLNKKLKNEPTPGS